MFKWLRSRRDRSQGGGGGWSEADADSFDSSSFEASSADSTSPVESESQSAVPELSSSQFLSSKFGPVQHYRVLFLGGREVGKTTLVKCLVHGELDNDSGRPSRSFSRRLRYCATSVYASCVEHFVPHRRMILDYVDSESNSRYAHFIRELFYPTSHVVVLVYDTTDRSSLERALSVAWGRIVKCLGESDESLRGSLSSSGRLSDDEEEEEDGFVFEPVRGKRLAFLVGTKCDIDPEDVLNSPSPPSPPRSAASPRRGPKPVPVPISREEASTLAVESGFLKPSLVSSRHFRLSCRTGEGLDEFVDSFLDSIEHREQMIFERLRELNRERDRENAYRKRRKKKKKGGLFSISGSGRSDDLVSDLIPMRISHQEDDVASTSTITENDDNQQSPVSFPATGLIVPPPLPTSESDSDSDSIGVRSLPAALPSFQLNLHQKKFSSVRHLSENVFEKVRRLYERLRRANANFENLKVIRNLFSRLRKRKGVVDETFAALDHKHREAELSSLQSRRKDQRRRRILRQRRATDFNVNENENDVFFLPHELKYIQQIKDNFRLLFERVQDEELAFNAKLQATDYGNLQYEGQWTQHTHRFFGMGRLSRVREEGSSSYILLYFGEFEDGKRHGKGREYHPDGETVWYYGSFQNGLRHGSGIEFDEEGEIVNRGLWANGVFTTDFNETAQVSLFDMKPYRKQMLSDEAFIARGGFANVYRIELDDGRHVAFKHFPGQMDEEQLEMMKTELGLMAHFDHPRIIRLVGVSYESPAGILQELADDSVAHKIRVGELSPQQKLRIVYGTAQGLEYLHLQSVYHRDIKWQNVLLKRRSSADPCGEVKIIDFGLSRVIESFRGSGQNLSRVGTPIYMSPEVFLGQPYSGKCDVYAFGIMLFEIIFDTLDPYNIKRMSGFAGQVEFQIVRDDLRPTIPNDIELDEKLAELTRLMEQCWDRDPECRPTFTGVLEYLVKCGYREQAEVVELDDDASDDDEEGEDEEEEGGEVVVEEDGLGEIDGELDGPE